MEIKVYRYGDLLHTFDQVGFVDWANEYPILAMWCSYLVGENPDPQCLDDLEYMF